jgi:hypothetical protein
VANTASFRLNPIHFSNLKILLAIRPPSISGILEPRLLKSNRTVGGWKVFEAPGVELVFPEKRQAINYAQNRANFRSGKIRILDSSGNVERTIA